MVVDGAPTSGMLRQRGRGMPEERPVPALAVAQAALLKAVAPVIGLVCPVTDLAWFVRPWEQSVSVSERGHE
jgi:hypothetical protein